VGVASSHDVYAPLLNRFDALLNTLIFIKLDIQSRCFLAGPLNVSGLLNLAFGLLLRLQNSDS